MSLKQALIRWIVIPLGWLLVRVHARTLRIRVEGEERVREHLARGGGVIFASWHQRFYAGIDYFRRYAPAIMISQSADGEMIARIVRMLGWTPVRGSSSRGGAEALTVMVEHVSKGQVGGHIVDGPRGPARRIKPGLLRLAQRARAPIMPAYVGYAKPWEARSWDRFQVPKPFSKVLIRFGRLIEIPATLEAEALDALREQLDREFAREYERVDADVRRLG